MPKITFYPCNNADSTLITLPNKHVMFDFANYHDPNDPDCKPIDLAEAVRSDLGWPKKKEIDVLALTHLDDDHINRSTEFFELDYAVQYQGADRVKIKELWVPAALLLENEDSLIEEARAWRQEARHRLKKNYGIRVFSRPDRLRAYLAGEGIRIEDRTGRIHDAGTVVPGVSMAIDGAEFFVHSPFADHVDGQVIDRNEACLVMQVTFRDGPTRLLLTADTDWENMQRIVQKTRRHENEARLLWDIYKIPHHCSYLGLGPDKGKTVTTAIPEIDWLLDQQGQAGAILVAPCEVIANKDTVQPPHFQAKNRYQETQAKKNGKFIVTMEHPSAGRPERVVIDIGRAKATVERSAAGISAITSTAAPRVG